MTSYQRRLAIKTQLEQLLFLLTTVIANATPANIDAAMTSVNNAVATGILQPRADYSLDGESYNWNAVRSQLLKDLEDVDRAVQRAKPFFLTTRMHT